MARPTLPGMVTHADLVEVARKWLARKCAVVVTEMASAAGEIPDAIGWQGSFSTLVECKLSTTDFRAEGKKQSWIGMGQVRYYLTPQGLVGKADIPEGWGLLEWDGHRVHATLKPVNREYNAAGEKLLLLSCLRRVGHAGLTGVSIKCYVYETQNRTTLTMRGIQPTLPLLPMCDHLPEAMAGEKG